VRREKRSAEIARDQRSRLLQTDAHRLDAGDFVAPHEVMHGDSSLCAVGQSERDERKGVGVHRNAAGAESPFVSGEIGHEGIGAHHEQTVAQAAGRARLSDGSEVAPRVSARLRRRVRHRQCPPLLHHQGDRTERTGLDRRFAEHHRERIVAGAGQTVDREHIRRVARPAVEINGTILQIRFRFSAGNGEQPHEEESAKPPHVPKKESTN